MSPTLVLCVFVPPGAHFGSESLQFVAGGFDEIVVLRCGVSDSKESSFRSSPILILDHEWQDSFAVARNHGLTSISTDFVLVIEHHERLTNEMMGLMRSLIEDTGELDIHCFKTVVEAPNGDVVEAIFEPRLWRRHNEYRYHGRSLEAVR